MSDDRAHATFWAAVWFCVGVCCSVRLGYCLEVTTRFCQDLIDQEYRWSVSSAMLPVVVLSVLLFIATAWGGERPIPHGTHPDLGPIPVLLDVIFSKAGPALPFLLFLVQTLVMPYGSLVEKQVLHDRIGVWGLPSRWPSAVLLVWIGMIFIRAVLYVPLSKIHDYFSDHIFLLSCLIAQVQTKLFLLHYASRRGVAHGWRFWVVFAVAWLLVGAILVEAFVTARYYHTVQATWTAFIVGTLIFSGAAFWWIGLMPLRQSDSDTKALLCND